VKVNAGAQVAAGTLLAIGKLPRLAALVLIGSAVPTTYAGHRFWELDDKQTRAQQRIHFLKNLGLIGA
jgi:putative oxidoreductase